MEGIVITVDAATRRGRCAIQARLTPRDMGFLLGVAKATLNSLIEQARSSLSEEQRIELETGMAKAANTEPMYRGFAHVVEADGRQR